MSGGGSNRPQAVTPTVNTSTVQHAGTSGTGVGGTNGGKSGGNPFGAPAAAQPQAIQFGGYGQQSPFGMTNPSQWGGVNLGGATQTQVTGPTFTDQANNINQQRTDSARAHELSLAQANNPSTTTLPDGGVNALSPEEYANASPDTQYNNNLGQGDQYGGAGAGGFTSGITGKGDDWGSSINTGTQSNVGLQDHAIALGESAGGFSPIVGGVTGVVSDRVAPKNQFQKDNRTAQEVSIDRHTKRWQDSNDDGPSLTHQEILDKHALQRNEDLGYSSTPSQSAAAAGFDMNDPSTWVQEEDTVNLKNTGSSQSSNDDDGGSGGSSGGK